MIVAWSRKATREFQRLPPLIQKRIADKMRFFADQPFPLEFAEPLTDHRLGSHRFRIGSFRVIVDTEATTLTVIKIAKRDSVYD